MSTIKPDFEVSEALERIEKAVAPYPKAALFDLFERGYTSLFEQLIACIISIRTYDEVTVPAAEALFRQARSPEEIEQLSESEIANIIQASSYAGSKSSQIREIARQTREKYGGELPADFSILTGFKGVGPKCAGLALGIAAGEKRIGVDIHVHRVTNRWGYVEAPTPEKTMLTLEKVLPREHWVNINRLLVPFGKHICTGQLPHCSSCPVADMCQQVGVKRHR